MIGHDPHELAAYLSAVLQGYTRQSAQAELERCLLYTSLSAVSPFPADNGDFTDRQAAVFAAVRPFHTLPEAVSYTHLDVYKRQ